jgi:Flp pilus assembly protein TadD
VDKDPAGALEEYRMLRELYPDFMPAWNNAGRILLSLGRHGEAAAMFEKAAEMAPRNSIPLMNLWFCQNIFLKDIRAAETTARRYVALAPELGNSHSSLGYSLAVQEKFPEAEKELRKAVELEPGQPYALPNLAHTLLAAGKADEAVPIYRRVYELGPQGGMTGDPAVNAFGLAVALKEAGNREEAKRVATEAEASLLKELGKGKLNDKNYDPLLGMLNAVSGNTGKARAYLNKALAAAANDADAILDLAGLYAQLGQVEQAVGLLKKALDKGSADPFFPVILPDYLPIRNDPGFRALFMLTK